MSGLVEAIFGTPEIVTIVLKTRYPKIKRRIFCINCGGFLQMTYKEVGVIIHGACDPLEVTSEIKCMKCKAVYELC